MQGDTAARESNSPAVGLFQKAHGKMVMLQRLDAQLGSLLEQRRKIQDELSSVQLSRPCRFSPRVRRAGRSCGWSSWSGPCRSGL